LKSKPTLVQTSITKKNIQHLKYNFHKPCRLYKIDANASDAIIMYALSHQLSNSNVNKAPKIPIKKKAYQLHFVVDYLRACHTR